MNRDDDDDDEDATKRYNKPQTRVGFFSPTFILSKWSFFPGKLIQFFFFLKCLLEVLLSSFFKIILHYFFQLWIQKTYIIKKECYELRSQSYYFYC